MQGIHNALISSGRKKIYCLYDSRYIGCDSIFFYARPTLIGQMLPSGLLQNKREARLLTVHARTKAGSHTVEASKSCPLLRCDADRLCSEAMRLLHKFQRLAGSNSSHSTWYDSYSTTKHHINIIYNDGFFFNYNASTLDCC